MLFIGRLIVADPPGALQENYENIPTIAAGLCLADAVENQRTRRGNPQNPHLVFGAFDNWFDFSGAFFADLWIFCQEI
jgi:hypothetical protein